MAAQASKREETQRVAQDVPDKICDSAAIHLYPAVSFPPPPCLLPLRDKCVYCVSRLELFYSVFFLFVSFAIVFFFFWRFQLVH